MGDICVPLFIPDDPDYVALLVRAIRILDNTRHYEQDAGHSAKIVSNEWSTRTITPLIEALASGVHCGGCLTLRPYHPQIEWFPQNPYTQPNFVPEDYLFPPWYIANDVTVALLDAEKDAAVTSIERFPAGFLPSWIPASGWPQFRVNVNGTGVVEVHLTAMNAGGLVQVTVDDNILGIEWYDTNQDKIAVPPETGNVIIFEKEFTTPGAHKIDCIMLPQVDDTPFPLRFGGGLVKVELCGFTPQAPGQGDDLHGLQMRLDVLCGMEFSTDGGSIWQPVTGWDANSASCFLGDTGAAGLDGADGTDGADGADGTDGIDGIDGDDGQTANEYPPQPDPDTDEMCGAVWYIAEEIEAQIQQSITDALTVSLADYLLANLQLGGFISLALDTFYDWLLVTVDATLSANVNVAIPYVAEHLYCTDLDVAATKILIAADTAYSANARDAWVKALDSYTDGKIALWAFVGAQDTTRDCSSFCGWCVEHDWTGSNANGWVVGASPQSAGVLGASGWDSEDVHPSGLTAQRIVKIDRTFTSALVTGIHLDCNYTKGSFDTNRRAFQFITEDAAVRTDVYIIMSNDISSGTPISFDWDDAGGQQMDLITIFLRSSTDATSPYSYSGVVQLHNVEICGEGSQPGDL